MNRVYLIILLEILVLVAAISVDFGGDVLHLYENSSSAKLQANLLAIQLNEARQPLIREDKKEISLLFVGDIMLSRGVANQIQKNKNSRYPFLKIAEEIERADLAFGNLENPVSSRGKDQGSIYSLRAEPGVVDGLKFAGFDGLFLANNHIWDWGREALEDTIDILGKNNIQPIGAGRDKDEANSPLIVDFQNAKLAFLSYTNLYPKILEAQSDSPGVSEFDVQEIGNEILEMKQLGIADIIIISFHWGDEYKSVASEAQKRIAHELIDSGADLIVGHHPHVIQESEIYKDKYIFYSLGNFVFDQDFSEETNRGLMLKVKIQDKKIKGIEEIKIKINKTFQAELNNL